MGDFGVEDRKLTNIEAAPPCLLPSAAKTDGGEGHVGHISNLGHHCIGRTGSATVG